MTNTPVEPDQPRERPVEEQYLSFAPSRYAWAEPGVSGTWRVLSDEGRPVAVVFTDYNQAAGIAWVWQSDAVTEIDQAFQRMRAGDVPAAAAYTAITSRPGLELGPEQTGDLAGIDEVIAGSPEQS